MILAMPKKITLESLAIMLQGEFKEIYRRFDAVGHRFDGIDERLDTMEARLSRIEHSILIDHRDRIERLEDRAFGKGN